MKNPISIFKRWLLELLVPYIEETNKKKEDTNKDWVTYMYGIATTYGVVSLLLLGGFAYLTFKMTSKKWDICLF